MSYAQDFKIIGISEEIQVGLQATHSSNFYVDNLTSHDQRLTLSLNQKTLLGGSNALICSDGLCSSSKIEIFIPSGERSEKLEIILRGGLTDFKSSILLEVQDTEFNRDLDLEIPVRVSNLMDNEIFFEKNNIKVNNFYPNPASEKAIMQYNLNGATGEIKIILQNVLGGIVKEYLLDPKDYELQLDTKELKPGVYFYTLLLEDEGLATRKLIVKK